MLDNIQHKNKHGDTLELYQSLINTALCPMIGYEFVSKKIFYFKAYIMGAFFREQVLYYYAYPRAGFTFGFKLKRNK